MPSPTTRASTITRPSTPSRPLPRGKARGGEPPRITPNLVEPTSRGIDALPLAEIIGLHSLAPYAWIILKGDEDREARYEINLGANLGKGAPTRHGLRSMRIINENGKHPTVEFDLYVPEYRKGGPNDDLDLARPLQKFRVGAEFSIKWGYRDAHTQWGLFRVMERDIQFSQGTALLTIKAQMGYKMSSTITSDVFSTTFGVSAIDKLARLINMPVNLKHTLFDEYRSLLTDTENTAVSGGGTISAAIYKETQKYDLDMLYDPEQDELRLVTPFKLDLVSSGSKPIKMTYGFPNSPIESLRIETKHPKKSGRGARSTQGVQQALTGADVDEKSGTVTSVVRGTVRVSGQTNVFLNFGYITNQGLPNASMYEGNSAFPNGPNGTVEPEKGLNLTASNVIANAERVYPPDQGYIVSINSDLNNFAPPAKRGYYHVIIQRKFKLPKSWRVTRDDLKVYKESGELESLTVGWSDQLEINTLSGQAQRGQIAFVIQGLPVTVQGKLRYPVKIYSYAPAKSEGSAPKGGAREEKQHKSTTISTEPRSSLDSTPEGEEFQDVATERPDDFYIRSSKLLQRKSGKPLPPVLENELRKFEALEAKLKREAKSKGQRVIRRDMGHETVLVLQERRPDDPNRVPEQVEQTADTASADVDNPRSDAKPLGVTSGKARPSRKLTLMTLRIRMKAGDWTLRTGKLIEIVDVYESINGIYYIHGEEHVIDDSGFHTDIICKKATSKQIAQYGTTKRVRKGTRKPTSGEKGDKSKATEAKRSSTVETPTTELKQDIEKARKASEERKRRFKRNQRSAAHTATLVF